MIAYAKTACRVKKQAAQEAQSGCKAQPSRLNRGPRVLNDVLVGWRLPVKGLDE